MKQSGGERRAGEGAAGREGPAAEGREVIKLLCICRAVSGDRNGIIPNLHV